MNEQTDKSVYDKNGIPILPGDTLKIYHYTDPRRRERRYMYKYVKGYSPSGVALEVLHLQPTGGSYWIMRDETTKADVEIVQGFEGVRDGLDYRSRKRKATINAAESLCNKATGEKKV